MFKEKIWISAPKWRKTVAELRNAAYTTTEIDWLPNKEQWKNLTTIGAIHTEFTKGSKTGSEWHYYISSRKLTREELLKHARLEWAAESIHWLTDVHFQEDKTKIWDINVQKNLTLCVKSLSIQQDSTKTATSLVSLLAVF